MAKLSTEATIGLGLEVLLAILERLHVREPWIIWGLFAVGLLLIGDSIVRGEWADNIPDSGRRQKKRIRLGVITIAAFAIFGFWIFARIHAQEGNGVTIVNETAQKLPAPSTPTAPSGSEKEKEVPAVVPAPKGKLPNRPASSEKLQSNIVAPPGSMVQSNSGGVNVQQGTAGDNSPIIDSPITVGEIPKRIAPRDLTTVTQYLENATAKMRIQVSSAQNSNSLAFAQDIYKAFKDAHWTVEGNGVSEPIVIFAGKRFEGVTISCKGPRLAANEKARITPGEPLYYVGTVLQMLKVPTVLNRDPDQKDADLITLQFTGLPND